MITIEDIKKFKLETPTVESLSKRASGSDTVEINGFGGPVTIDKSTLKYGRNKTATPFKLNKYKKFKINKNSALKAQTIVIQYP